MTQGIENLTPMLRQYLEIKENHRDAILFFRLGDFYEMFFDDALKASQLLNIALTSRNKNAQESVPLCGIPYHSASSYIRKLIENGCKVAICEQVEDPKLAKGIVKREVIRVISPGLWIDQENLATHESNYLAAVLQEGEGVHLGFIEIATGEVLLGYYENSESALQELSKHRVKELLLSSADSIPPWVKRLEIEYPQLLLSRCEAESGEIQVGEIYSQGFLDSFHSIKSSLGKKLLNRLLSYVYKTQRSLLHHLGSIQILRERQYMGMDERTFRHLELIHNSRGEGSYGTLFWVLNKNQTAMGARRLKRWIHYPLLDLSQIQSRQEGIGEFLERPEILLKLQEDLKQVQDIERMLGKLALVTVNARDLSNLAHSLQQAHGIIREVRPQLHGEFFQGQLQSYPDLSYLFQFVLSQLLAELPLTVREGGMIADGVHHELDELRSISRDGKSFIAAMEEQERKRTGISSLKIRYNRVFGYYIEITNTHRESVPQDYIRKQTLANAERFITPQLKEYENKVLGAEERIKTLEYELFCQVRQTCVENLEAIRKVAEVLGNLDALASLAKVARDQGFSRPIICEGKIISLKDSRHPVLEQIHPEERYIPNDIEMNEETGRLFLITGPNMAGKSTVMRQAALIILMAQMGSYVPAKEAKIGIVDQLFTRIGASDDLSRGESTFMVEMLETAYILKTATEQSFIVLDEIGRGTSTYDGMSIAWAVAEFVAQKLKCRALFATHYHELTELSQTVSGVANYQVAVKEWNDQILFLRKLIPGGASRSYGIEVARLAGLPEGLLDRARDVLHSLENMEGTALGKIGLKKEAVPQLGLFDYPHREILDELKQVQPEIMSPLEALEFLFKIKDKISKL